MAEVRRKVGVQLGGGGDIGGGVRAYRNLHSEKAEYGRTVYCNVIDSGTVRGGGEEVDCTGRDAVEGTGRT